jgi:hypothetical protein
MFNYLVISGLLITLVSNGSGWKAADTLLEVGEHFLHASKGSTSLTAVILNTSGCSMCFFSMKFKKIAMNSANTGTVIHYREKVEI